MGARALACGRFIGFIGLFAGVACGGRTGLWTPPSDALVATDGGGFDAGLPGLHITVAPPPPACADAGSTVIYLVTQGANLVSFDPGATTPEFPLIGHLQCPTTGSCGTMSGSQPASPFSMAVDRTGTAYVVYCDGELFQVSTATARCQATGFRAPQAFAAGFGMGFSQDDSDPGETLYVASASQQFPTTLAAIQTSDDALQVVGPVDPPATQAELTGTGAGTSLRSTTLMAGLLPLSDNSTRRPRASPAHWRFPV